MLQRANFCFEPHADDRLPAKAGFEKKYYYPIAYGNFGISQVFLAGKGGFRFSRPRSLGWAGNRLALANRAGSDDIAFTASATFRNLIAFFS
jgi:hypothetical protein